MVVKPIHQVLLMFASLQALAQPVEIFVVDLLAKMLTTFIPVLEQVQTQL